MSTPHGSTTQLNNSIITPKLNVFGTKEFDETSEKNIQDQLNTKLTPSEMGLRKGQGNTSFNYLESWKAISLANSIFGFNGWSCDIVECAIDYIDETKDGKYEVGVTALVRVILRDGTYHTDIGYGDGINARKGMAIEKAKKEAVSDARKRALRLFGDRLGNCVYDKVSLQSMKSGNFHTTSNSIGNNAKPFNNKANSNKHCTIIRKAEGAKPEYAPYPKPIPRIEANAHIDSSNASIDKNNIINMRKTTVNNDIVNAPSLPNNNYENAANMQRPGDLPSTLFNEIYANQSDRELLESLINSKSVRYDENYGADDAELMFALQLAENTRYIPTNSHNTNNGSTTL